MQIPVPIRFPADGELDQLLADLAGSGVYALYSPTGPPYLGWSSRLGRRLSRLLKARSGLLSRLGTNFSAVECWQTGSRLETSLLLYELSKLYYPGEYLTRLRLRMPWFLALTDDPFPRVRIANRLSRRDHVLFGPFRNRDTAQVHEQQIESLFQIRRCTETLSPAPDHPGCIYGEMNQCLRPCQCAVTPEEYRAEVGRVAEFLASNGKNSLALLASARDRACAETEFEQAAQIHKRLEKVREAAQSRDAVITDARQFHGIALTRANKPRNFLMWPMWEGFWQEPVALDFSNAESRSVSLDHELRARLGESLAGARTTGKRVEELAIFARWYFSSWRDGDWFPFRSLADLNYRKLVRQISQLVREAAA